MTQAIIDGLHMPTLLTQFVQNRFLPIPSPSAQFCGDGDFLAIGAEFLGHFVRLGGLRRHHRVLDIGCGLGRMALPLTQFLYPKASYDGVDVVKDGIDWCQKIITPAYPSVRFHHLDAHHALYNPTGTLGQTPKLPFADQSFDFIMLVSVLTHLDGEAMLHYASECARLLAPGGRVFTTAFLLNAPARAGLAAGKTNQTRRIEFEPDAPGPVAFGIPEQPMAAVAFDEDYLLEKFWRFGLRRKIAPLYGHWSGRTSESFQDLCIFERA